MEKIFLILTAIYMLTLISCGEDISTQSGILKRDCTGTYLEFDGQEYKICNPEIVDTFQANEILNVELEYISTCDDAFPCLLYHPYEAWIEIKQIL